MILHDLKALFLQPLHLSRPGIVEIHAGRPHQGEGKEPHVPPGRDLVVQLAHRAAAEIPGILIFCLDVCDLLIDPFKIPVSDHRFPPENQLSLISDLQRDIAENPGVVGDHLAHFTISPGDRLPKFPALIGEHNGQAVHLPGQQGVLIPQEFF